MVLTSCRRLCRQARYSSRTEEREAGLNEQFENSRCSHSEYPHRRLRLKRALVKRLGVNTSLTVHNCPSNSDCLTNSYGVARRYTVWDSTSPSPKTEDIPTNMHKFVLWTVLSAALTTSFPAHGQLPSGAKRLSVRPARRNSRTRGAEPGRVRVRHSCPGLRTASELARLEFRAARNFNSWFGGIVDVGGSYIDRKITVT